MPIPFCKFHGFGNDYIVIERRNIPNDLDQIDLALSLCQRHTGVGSDGIAIIETADGSEADFFCEIVNPDGSVAGFSGNGTRCAVSYIYFRRLWNQPTLRLRTRSGVNNYRLIDETGPGHYRFEAAIGKPKFACFEIPIAEKEPLSEVLDWPVSAAGRDFQISCINVGNPVGCIFVEEFEPAWRAYGKALESHPLFPQKANIVFVKVEDRSNIHLKIWERGAGETSSSGTCVSAAGVLSARKGLTERTASVHTDGGTTEFLWRDDDEMLITGRADLAFCGEY